MAETYSAGIVTAYGAAVRGGYTGTYEQWCQDMAQLGDNVSEVREKAAQVEQTAQSFTQTIIPAAIQSVENEGTAQVGAVTNAGSAQVQAVETAGTTQTGNVNAAGAAQVQAVNDEGVLKVGAVEAAGAAQVQAVEAAGTDATEAVENAGTAATSDIDTAKTDALTALQAESTTQQAAIQQKGEDTRASIPDDYTALRDEVVELKSAVDQKAPAIYDTASGAVASFEDGADGMPLKSLTVNIEPVQAGSGDPSPENVRPISGWTGCNVKRMGVNLWDEDWEVGSINNSTGANVPNTAVFRSKNYIPVIPGGTFFCYCGDIKSLGSQIALPIYCYGKDKGYLGRVATPMTVNNSTFTVPDNCYFIRFRTGSDFPHASVYQNDISINYPATDTAYHAYKGNTYTITFPTEAGTVCGGTLTINADGSGELVVDMASAILNELSWRAYGQNYYTESLASVIKRPLSTSNTVGCLCEICKETYHYYGSTHPDEILICVASPGNVLITGALYNALQTSGNVRFAYPLASPITYQLTAQQITTLLGTNNIWADCGPVEVDYPADTKLYIERLTAPEEDDMIANAQIASGKYFMIGNNLYLSTTVIPAGDTIIPGTNCTKTNLAAALNALNV